MNLLPLLWTLLLLAVTTGIFLTAATRAKARLKKQYPPIGQKIDIGDYRLHMHAEVGVKWIECNQYHSTKGKIS